MQQTSNLVTDEPVSSSDVQSPPLAGLTFSKPRPLTLDEIADVVKRFAFAAQTLYNVCFSSDSPLHRLIAIILCSQAQMVSNYTPHTDIFCRSSFLLVSTRGLTSTVGRWTIAVGLFSRSWTLSKRPSRTRTVSENSERESSLILTTAAVILCIKINSHDFSEGGFGPEECKEIATRLEAAGVDIIELSGGTYETSDKMCHLSDSTRRREAFYIE